MRTRLLFAVFACLMAWQANAQVIGTYGTVYDIQEEDPVKYIKSRLAEMQKDGTIDRMQKEGVNRVRNHLLHMPPVPGITTASEHKIFFWDPTFTLQRDITDGKGHIVYPAGYRFNPLTYGGLNERLLFIDQRDQSQVDIAVRDKKTHPRDLIILTAGSFYDLSKQMHQQVYYDQFGYMTKKFGIKHVPAIVSQDGLKIKIEEGVK